MNILIAIHRNCAKYKLQTGDVFLRKILELYEMIIVRHGLMLVGYSFGAKTAAYTVLADALTDLNYEGLNGEYVTRWVGGCTSTQHNNGFIRQLCLYLCICIQ